MQKRCRQKTVFGIGLGVPIIAWPEMTLTPCVSVGGILRSRPLIVCGEADYLYQRWELCLLAFEASFLHYSSNRSFKLYEKLSRQSLLD